MTDSGNNTPRLIVERIDQITAIRFPRGIVDGVAVREMFEAAAALMDHHNLRMLVDFTGVNMVPSGAMGMLVTIRKKLMHIGGQLHVAIPDPNVKQTFVVTRLDQLLSLFDTPEAARGAFKA